MGRWYHTAVAPSGPEPDRLAQNPLRDPQPPAGPLLRWASGDSLLTDSTNLIATTEDYLRVTAERQLRASEEFVAGGAEFVYPTGTYHSLTEVFAAGERRYRWIRKRHATWDLVEKGDGNVVVVSAGTLFGENRHGRPFEGVRYVDRITFRDGLITRQEVWNDLASSGVLDQEPSDTGSEQRGVEQHEQEAR